MDYSILLEFDQETNKMICGVIDYLVPYDLAKRLEHLLKSVLLICACKDERPTVINPTSYKIRFLAFIENEFKCVIEWSPYFLFFFF